MNVDENVFFREATLRICSSLNIVEALKSCFDYVKLYIPMNRIYLHIYDADLIHYSSPRKGELSSHSLYRLLATIRSEKTRSRSWA